ncbi:MAG: hypothetical protein M0P19_08300 [Nevskia sp.]|jgi:hypothetical protein|nr:hypothetical protein [Nevskia sp.]MCK9385123.1 hypothetical protein [Nevskia sp.]
MKLCEAACRAEVTSAGRCEWGGSSNIRKLGVGEQARIRQLEAESEQLRCDVDILKKPWCVQAVGAALPMIPWLGEVTSMSRTGRLGLPGTQKTETLRCWKAGQSLAKIGFALSGRVGSIYGVVSAQGGIARQPDNDR